MPQSLTVVGVWGHAICSLGFFGLAMFFLRHKPNTNAGWTLLSAILITAIWAGIVALASVSFAGLGALVSPLETIRTAAWIGFLVLILARSWQNKAGLSFSLIVAVILSFVFTAQFLLDTAQWLGWGDGLIAQMPGFHALFILSRLLVAVGGLLLIHNLYINSVPANRWSIRLLCIALAGMFAYDFNMYVLVLLGRSSDSLLAARGVVNLMIVPLLAISYQRNRSWKLELQLSRQVVFTSFSLVAIGSYLMLMAFGFYALKLVGGSWSALLQIVFLFATLVLLAVLAVSGKVRSWTRVQINKHFFAYKYDYRAEWLRFIATIADNQSSDATLQTRVIQAICDLVDSPGGALWLPDVPNAPNGQLTNYTLHTRWNFRTAKSGAEPADGKLVTFLSDRQRVVDFDELREQRGDYDSLTTPDWAEQATRAWLALPLLHSGRLAGFAVVEKPRAERSLNWEDFDLLKTIGRQSASYLAEQASEKALLETVQFDAFNRRFAFIMHDIKNLVSQLSLVSRNAERHADKPDFQKDMLLTLRDSVTKMNDLLARLKQHNTGRADMQAVDLAVIIASVVSQKGRSHGMISFASDGNDMILEADANRLEQVFQHLLQNAIDASSGKPIEIDVRRSPNSKEAWITLTDHGCGMSDAFLREALFTPFRSTKVDGFGIGAYEAREIVRAHGGRLEVKSEFGTGSVFTIILPLRDHMNIDNKTAPLQKNSAAA